MGTRNEHRVKKLEQRSYTKDNQITEIIVSYINPDGSVSGNTVTRLIDGVWCEWTEEGKSTS